MRIRNKNKGFSLVELIITITILAVVTSFFVPSFIRMMNESRVKKDVVMFESISTAFKKSLSEPEVRKEVEQLGLGEKITVMFKIQENGLIDFNSGLILGTQRTPIQNTALWLNTYQHVGLTYEMESKDFNGKSLVCELTPKTEKTTAKCVYRIEEAVICGDLDGSGDITQSDIDALRQYLNGRDAVFNNWQMSMSDMNGDGVLNYVDLDILQRCFNTGEIIEP